MAVAMPFILMGMSMIGAMSSANAAKTQAQNESTAAEYNAKVADRNAGIAREQTAYDMAAQERTNLQKSGEMRAGYGASGVTLEGSPLDVLEMSSINQQLDVQQINYKGALRAMGYEDTAGLDRMRSGAALEYGEEKASAILLEGIGKSAQTGYDLGAHRRLGMK